MFKRFRTSSRRAAKIIVFELSKNGTLYYVRKVTIRGLKRHGRNFLAEKFLPERKIRKINSRFFGAITFPMVALRLKRNNTQLDPESDLNNVLVSLSDYIKLVEEEIVEPVRKVYVSS